MTHDKITMFMTIHIISNVCLVNLLYNYVCFSPPSHIFVSHKMVPIPAAHPINLYIGILWSPTLRQGYFQLLESLFGSATVLQYLTLFLEQIQRPGQREDDQQRKLQLEIAEILLNKGVSHVVKNRQGKSPLDVAVSDKLKKDFSQILLSR